MSRVEELEAKLEQQRADKGKLREAQYEIDLEARIALEEEHGTICGVKVSVFVPGQPTHAYLRMPTGPEYKKYKHQVHLASRKDNVKGTQQAAEDLARAVWVYPATTEAKDAMLAAFPGLITPLQNAAATLAEGKSEEEGKG